MIITLLSSPSKPAKLELNWVKYAKKLYYSGTTEHSKNDGKKLWKVVKSILPTKGHECVKEAVINDIRTEEHKQIAKVFKNFFLQRSKKKWLFFFTNDDSQCVQRSELYKWKSISFALQSYPNSEFTYYVMMT